MRLINQHQNNSLPNLQKWPIYTWFDLPYITFLYRRKFPNVRASISPFFQYFGGKLPSIDWKLNKFSEDLFFSNFFHREKFQKVEKLNTYFSEGSKFVIFQIGKIMIFTWQNWPRWKSKCQNLEPKVPAIDSWRPPLQCCCCSENRSSSLKNSKSTITESHFLAKIASSFPGQCSFCWNQQILCIIECQMEKLL